ncbi:MAG TPA: hypothetical protein VN032_07190 [Thermoanaerobaculia bacterium]|nr:hypothetical protein [Thermoanaerobaculia bacterium]
MRYRLAPWEDVHAIRRMERYDAASEEAREGERRDRRHDAAKGGLSILLAPLSGLLPAAIQKKMERDFGTPAVLTTVASAAPLFLVGMLGLVRFLMRMAGASLAVPGWLAPAAVVAAYLFGESALRLASAIGAGEPMGSLPVVLGAAAWQALRAPRGAPPAEPGPEMPPADEEHARDRELFHMLEPVLALLASNDQELLAARFGFDALRWGRRTAAVLLAAAVLNTAYSLAAFAHPGGIVVETLWALPALLLAVEQVRRLRSLKAGRPAGSVLGRLVRPLAKPLLGPERPAPI